MFISENANISCSFSTFARMIPDNFVLNYFVDRKTFLCTQYQNFELILEMMLKKHNKVVQINLDVFLKYTDQKIISVFADIKEMDFTFKIWNKVEAFYKAKKKGN